MYRATGELPPEETEHLFVDVDVTPVWDPEKGPLDERRDVRDWAEEMTSDEINIEHTAYWFTEPPGGWELERRYQTMEEVEPTFPNPYHEDDDDPLAIPLTKRMPYEELEEGDELLGVVTDIWLHHGAQVDFAGHIDGLIPIQEDEWPAVEEDIMPGTVVKVRVHKLMQPRLYRWPVHLELLHERVAPLITPPNEWESPADLAWAYDQGWTMEEIYAKLGRPIPTSRLYVQPDDTTLSEVAHAEYAWDNDEEVPPNMLDEVSEALDPGTMAQIQRIVTRMP